MRLLKDQDLASAFINTKQWSSVWILIADKTSLYEFFFLHRICTKLSWYEKEHLIIAKGQCHPERTRLQNSRFFLKIRKEIGKENRSKSLARAKRASLKCPWGERKETYFSLPSLALCFQPCSRPSVWLLERNKYAKIRTVLQSKKGLKNVVGLPPNLNERGRFLQSANCILFILALEYQISM